MKKLVLVLVLVLVSLPLTVWAGEKEEYQWRVRALIAEANLANARLQEAQNAVRELVKELDAKGLMVKEDGMVVEKPKPASTPAPAPAKPPEKK